MKLTTFQLEQHLNKTLHPLYILCGDEHFLLQETTHQIRQKAFDLGFKERIRLDIETDEDLEIAYSHAYTKALFQTKRVIDIHLKGNKLTARGQKFLIDFSLEPSPHTLLLVRLAKLDTRTEKTLWFKNLEKNSIVIPIWPIQPHQIPMWIMNRAKTLQLNMTREAAEHLSFYAQGNLSAASQELEKLSLADYPVIDRTIIDHMVADLGTFNAFDLVDQALAGNALQCLRILNNLKREGVEPLLILGALVHELRNLIKIFQSLEKDSTIQQVFSQLRVRMNRQPLIRTFLNRSTKAKCQLLLLKAGQMDRLLKGALEGAIWPALESFSLSLAGMADIAICIYT